MLIAPVDVPVLMSVLKLDEPVEFSVTAPPVTVAPRFALKASETVSAPALVVVIPVRPSLMAVVLDVVPIAKVPAVARSRLGAITPPENVAVLPVKVVVPAVPIVPVVVIVSEPLSITPKPEVIDPEFSAPVEVILPCTKVGNV